MHSKSDNKEVMSHDKADEATEEIFETLLPRYHIGLETSLKGSSFIFRCVDLVYYICHKTNFNRGGSYIDSPDRIKNKVTVNLINKNDNKCFQYAVASALKCKEIKKGLQRT